MSLFEKINKRILVEKKNEEDPLKKGKDDLIKKNLRNKDRVQRDAYNPTSNSFGPSTGEGPFPETDEVKNRKKQYNQNRRNNNKPPLSDEEKLYRTTRDKKSKELGYKSGSDFERTVTRGIKAVDKKPTGKNTYPRVGYATGEPFQADDNLDTLRYKTKQTKPVKDQINNISYRELRQAKVPGTGKYPTSGKKVLQGRLVDYPSMDKDFSKAVKSGEVERDVAKRLKTRLKYTAGTELGGDEGVDKFVSKVMKAQKGTIGTGKGKDSDLYKIIKRDIDNRNPTIPSKTYNKEGERQRLPKPGGFDDEGKRTGTKAQQARYDATAERRAAKFDDEIVKQAKLPKGLKIPKGGEYNKDPKTGEMKRSSPLQPKELNVKFKAAKLKLDYGGRFAKKASKDELAKIKKDAALSKAYADKATKVPQRFSTYKYDRNNVVSTGLKGRTAPKFKDRRNTIAYRVDRKPGQRIGFDTFKDPSKVKFAKLKTKSTSVKPTFSDVFKRNATRAATKPIRFARKNPYTAIGLSLAAAPFVNNKVQNMLFNKRQNEKLKNFKPKYDSATKTDIKNLFK